jgi:hypothetical protein
METLAELVEAPVDWLAEIPDGRTQVIAKLIVDEADPIASLTRLVGDTADLQIVNGPIGELPPGNEPRRQRELRDAFLNEIHNFLCGDAKYSEERQRIQDDCRPGQTFVAANIAIAITPYVNGSAHFIAAGVAMTLTVIGKMGLNAWCVVQKRRRSTDAN